ncbi:hypothetical protein CPLU01_08747 [Colletotrichum plurivorum]|uniref:Tesmin/TSO1-like CXC domain-containing protein n=1 Tax=Colletotrichum plurivorum TaxID=2175906 RepID=A0A8H6KAJ3_9PEZI|nr:hypothetical protein CPLU01_08747 [Colletotrichum plurivorum]
MPSGSGKRKASPIEIASDSDANPVVDLPPAWPIKKTKIKNSERLVTEVDKWPRKDLPTKCNCKTGCKGSCACVTNGFACGPSCRCSSCADGPGKCTKKLNDFFKFLGDKDEDGGAGAPGDENVRMRAEPCFATFAARSKGPISLRMMMSALQAPHDVFQTDFDPWIQKWTQEKASLAEGDLLAYVKKLLRHGLIRSKRHKMFYWSFCRDYGHRDGIPGTWVRDTTTWHCETCKECQDWCDWHCGKCNKCTYGTLITFSTLTGISTPTVRCVSIVLSKGVGNVDDL